MDYMAFRRVRKRRKWDFSSMTKPHNRSSSGQGTLCPSLDLPGANSALQLLGIKRKRRGAKLTLTRRWRHKSVTCPHCGTRISRKNDLARHIISVHEWREEAEVRKIVEEKERLWCLGCRKILSRRDSRRRHEASCHEFGS
jgi:uncharacterized C2H2 Zn-finger protein